MSGRRPIRAGLGASSGPPASVRGAGPNTMGWRASKDEGVG